MWDFDCFFGYNMICLEFVILKNQSLVNLIRGNNQKTDFLRHNFHVVRRRQYETIKFYFPTQ